MKTDHSLVGTTAPHWQSLLLQGTVIPACPLVLNRHRRWDEANQLKLVAQYTRSGAGGLAVGVHTTQFQIRSQGIGLFKPVTQSISNYLRASHPSIIRIAGICGPTRQALKEAEWLAGQGYHAGLLSLGALRDASDNELVEHCRAVSKTIPIVGFYLQPAAGGRVLSFDFWKKFASLDQLIAVKIAPFNRYQTLDVIRALVESGRDDIALYTGNDDHIVGDLVTPFRFRRGSEVVERRIVGGLLGQWAVWTRRAVELHRYCREIALAGKSIPQSLLSLGAELTDANAAIFDAANGFKGCIPGIHEILRRQGLMPGTWCLDPEEKLSPGQKQEIDRIWKAYPRLRDDGPAFDFSFP